MVWNWFHCLVFATNISLANSHEWSVCGGKKIISLNLVQISWRNLFSFCIHIEIEIPLRTFPNIKWKHNDPKLPAAINTSAILYVHKIARVKKTTNVLYYRQLLCGEQIIIWKKCSNLIILSWNVCALRLTLCAQDVIKTMK